MDEKTHFNANVEIGNKNHPDLLFFDESDNVTISSGRIDSAYKGVSLTRTMALINIPELEQSLVIDVFDVKSNKKHQYDLPTYYKGHLISTSFELDTQLTSLPVLGKKNGYQHLWLKAQAKPESGLSQITWLNKNGRFYTQSSIMDGDSSVIFTQIGANDPLFNLRNENGFINRVTQSKNHTFINVLEPHGEFNPSKEFTVDAVSKIEKLSHKKNDGIDVVEIELIGNKRYLLALNLAEDIKDNQLQTFLFNGSKYYFTGRFKFLEIKE